MNTIEAYLNRLGFPQSVPTLGRTSIADLYSKDKRCGIYVLHCSSDEYYVGQAVDVVRRYAQHRHTHRDILRISFKRVSEAQLNFEEQETVHALESKSVFLRNVHLVRFPAGETDFDFVMSFEDQQRWLQDLDYIDLQGERIVDMELRRRYTRKFVRFTQLPKSEDAIAMMRKYVMNCIPAVKRSEVSFWSCSCLPGKNDQLYGRINVGWQVVFDVYVIANHLYCRWYMPRQLARRVYNPLRLRFQYHVVNSSLKAGGLDQVVFETPDLEDIQNKRLLLAVREFNLGLMRKSATPFGRYHCLDLADRLVN
jgi:hypothetical protein